MLILAEHTLGSAAESTARPSTHAAPRERGALKESLSVPGSRGARAIREVPPGTRG